MSFNLHTLETRWFYPGGVPSKLESWFNSLGMVEKIPPRTDLYLSGLGEDLGIKLREGRLEIKRRTAKHGQTMFSPEVSGLLEEWVKWSMAVEETAFGELSEQESWLAVRKTRQQVSFSLLSHGGLVPVDAGDFPPNGGSFELTEVHVLDQLWWTVGVEVFGEPEKLNEVLNNIMRFVMDRGLGQRLDFDHSLAYPGWVQQLRSHVD
jgi:hypothetical protein